MMSLLDIVLHVVVYGGFILVVYTGIILAICQMLKRGTRELNPNDTKLVKIIETMGVERRGEPRVRSKT